MKLKKLLFILFAAAVTLSLSAKPYNERQNKQKIQSIMKIAQSRDIAALKKAVADLKQDQKLSAVSLYTLALMEAGLAANGNPKAVKLPKSTVSAKDNEQAFFTTAKIFMHLRDYPMAQFFGNVELKEPPVYIIKTVKVAPKDVGSWENFKGKVEFADYFEKYNEKAAALLINDVNTVRETATHRTENNCPITFAVLADSDGFSIYMRNKTAKADEIFAGLANGGMYEMCLQPGHGEFYYQWLYYVNPEKCSFAEWMTNSRRYRSLSEGMKYASQKTADGVGTVFYFPWTLLYDRLPNAKSEWKLGVIPWVAGGGFTWGSGQVHELNKFGTIKFEGLEEIMPEIKRKLVLSAWAKYRRIKGNICIFWNDEQRGDRKFYGECIAPLVNKLDEYGELVKADMDAATVNKLFTEAVPEWNEFDYVVEGLRTDYLNKQFLEQE